MKAKEIERMKADMKRVAEGTRAVFLELLERFRPWTEAENPFPEGFREQILMQVLVSPAPSFSARPFPRSITKQ